MSHEFIIDNLEGKNMVTDIMFDFSKACDCLGRDLILYKLEKLENYITMFGGEEVLIPAYSSYFETLQPGPQVFHAAESSQFLTIILEVMIVLILVVLILLVSLCLLQKYTKQVAEAQGVEISLRNSLRQSNIALGPLVKERTGRGGYMTVSGGGLWVDCWLASLDRWL
ncbi:C6 finger domain-containing protein, variant [Homalodisca vitripennis]|nr:C6 finger domain-containing protein, variant [Homalodisca vitripennis]